MNLENHLNKRMISEKYYLRIFYDLLLQVNQLHRKGKSIGLVTLKHMIINSDYDV